MIKDHLFKKNRVEGAAWTVENCDFPKFKTSNNLQPIQRQFKMSAMHDFQ